MLRLLFKLYKQIEMCSLSVNEKIAMTSAAATDFYIYILRKNKLKIGCTSANQRQAPIVGIKGAYFWAHDGSSNLPHFLAESSFFWTSGVTLLQMRAPGGVLTANILFFQTYLKHQNFSSPFDSHWPLAGGKPEHAAIEIATPERLPAIKYSVPVCRSVAPHAALLALVLISFGNCKISNTKMCDERFLSGDDATRAFLLEEKARILLARSSPESARERPSQAAIGKTACRHLCRKLCT